MLRLQTVGVICLLTTASPLPDFGTSVARYEIPLGRRTVPRIPAGSLTRAGFAGLCEGQNATPVILTDAIKHWRGIQQKLTKEQLAQMAGANSIRFTVLQGRLGKQYSDLLSEFLSHLHESTHENAFYAVLEDLLFRNEPGIEDLFDMFGTVPLFEENGGNLFSLFPPALQPPSRALVLGGKGAKSSLHVDPYNWTGWNALLRGRKLWRFWPRTVSALSMGAFRAHKKAEAFIPSGFRSDADSFLTSSLKPDVKKFPMLMHPFLEVFQEPGEVVVIPSGWWHQVYHLTDCIGFASQFASIYNAPTIVGAIFEWNAIDWEQCAESTSAGPSNITVNPGQVLSVAIRCAEAKHHRKHRRIAADLPSKEDEL